MFKSVQSPWETREETAAVKRDLQANTLGCVPQHRGVAFRVWAPNARQVTVAGTFNNWSTARHELKPEGGGYWSAVVPEAKVGDEYRYVVRTERGELWRNDPYARALTRAKDNSVVYHPALDRQPPKHQMPPANELVIYELHVGTFNAPGTFDAVAARFDHLVELGVNAIELMPVMAFPGERSWGYNPSQMFAVESSYGGPEGLKRFVELAHRHGISVILDVVYNHMGPGGLDLWQFDGWQENGLGGIYFYNDWRAVTPWGHTRPNYSRQAVRDFIRDNALMWLEDYRVDGLRFDATNFMRAVQPDGQGDLPDGVSLLHGLNKEIRSRFPNCLTIAEDLQDKDWLTNPNGLAFSSQWCPRFINHVRDAMKAPDDHGRSLHAIRDALTHRYNGDPFQRVIYTESHDEVANGKHRLPCEIHPSDPRSWFAQKRSTLAAGLVFTTPGVPMLFQGQEFLEDKSFHDTNRIDWSRRDQFGGIVRLYRDLIRLRLNRGGATRGLCGPNVNVFHQNDGAKVLGFHRWDRGGVGDDVVVVANFSHRPFRGYRLGFPHAGRWKLQFNSDWTGYSGIFGDTPSGDTCAHHQPQDGLHASGLVDIGPYSLLVYAREG
ncbi:MAG: alpha-amylase family glycosyl hydrolase [Gemmataceae bacterium]